ncbi:aspartic peptidase domain-containing protein [Neurospora tetraspora]|uniref:Aspartic peptidase domain-containing protein n=1 Tax=Neurospora tetraspora TaxID=94610 RepID=A0AAE0JJ73_9PEZI|nr:aspartic peptidase domain-containing protein [Neurospora tetraspora]
MKSMTTLIAGLLFTSATAFRPNQPFTGHLERGLEHRSLDRRQETGKKSLERVPLEVDSRNNGKTELQWLATITVGTPPQTFKVVLDTGSTALILPRSNCTNCGKHSFFDPSKSTSFSPQPALFQPIEYGTGADTVPLNQTGRAECEVVTDTVSIQGLSAPKQEFMLCHSYGEALSSQLADGILGIGFNDISAWDENGNFTYLPLLPNLVSEGQLPNRIVGLALGSGGKKHQQRGPEASIGGADCARYRGRIKNVNVDETLTALSGTFIVDVKAAYIGSGNNKQVWRNSTNDNKPLTPGASLIDSGTAYMLTPDRQTAEDLYLDISKGIVPLDDRGSWGASCATLDKVATDITFTIGTETGGELVEVTMPKSAFNLGEYPGKKGVVSGGIFSLGSSLL